MTDSLRLEVLGMDRVLKNPNILATARSLTISSSSGMNRALDYYQTLIQDRSVHAYGIFAYYGKTESLELTVGWALLTFENDRLYFCQKVGYAAAQVFVVEEYRRQGIGSKLMKRAIELAQDSTICIYAHNNYDFFAPFMQLPNFQEL